MQGQSKHSAYESWKAMKRRCFDPNKHNFKHYGGRGIGVFVDWVDNFDAFVRDACKCNPTWAPGLQLDRINTNGHYVPGNVRWATPSQQNHNRRSKSEVAARTWVANDGPLAHLIVVYDPFKIILKKALRTY